MTDYNVTKLIDFNIWANQTWIEFITTRSIDDEYVLSQMSHILLGEQAWLQRIHGVLPDKNIWKTLSITELLDYQKQHEKAYSAIMTGDIQKKIYYQRFSGEEYCSPVADILIHLVLHGMYHRGKMADRVSKMGTKVINTDFIEYCRNHEL